jgi:hypothetical protein
VNQISYLLLGATLAASPLASAGPTVLDEQQLDRVTAGTADYGPNRGQFGGGAIVGNSSSATIKTTGQIKLEGSAQQGARAVNLVNGAESAVGNPVNIWDGRISSAGAATTLDVNQANSIAQDQSRTAGLQFYERRGANIDRQYSEWSKTTHTGSVDTTQSISGSGNLPEVGVQVGKGVSIAGEADLHIDAGSLSISNEVVLGSTHTVTNVELGSPPVVVTNTSDVVLASATQTFDWTLPEVTFSVTGAGCWVVMGKCDADGSYEKSVDETTVTRAPFRLQNAQAEYIVVDESSLDVTNEYSVTVSGDAQRDARAVNLVNTAGSLVANSVNIARTPSVGPSLNLNQVNIIVQRR